MAGHETVQPGVCAQILVAVIAVRAAAIALEIGANIRIGSEKFSDFGLFAPQIRVVYDVGVLAVAIREVRIRRQLAIPLLSWSSVLIVVADFSVHVVAYIGVIGEKLANTRPLVHFAFIANDIGISVELAGKIPVFILIEEPVPSSG